MFLRECWFMLIPWLRIILNFSYLALNWEMEMGTGLSISKQVLNSFL